MKKLLIVNNNLHIGGVQRALVDLLKQLGGKYDVTLALFHPEGELLPQIPEWVKILPVRSAYRYLGLSRYDVAGKPFLKLRRGFYAGLCRVFGRDKVISLMALRQKKLCGFDVAISYLHDGSDKVFYGGCNDFVLRHTDAAKKITFLHCDYSMCGADTAKNAARYEKFDVIAACSQGCADVFTGILPAFLKKVVVVPNIQDYNNIRRSASAAAVTLPEGRVNILTVARLGKEKGVGRAVEAFARLARLSGKYHYYVIGDGILRPQIEEAIRVNGLQEQITLLGEMENPYGYIQAADLLLIPSVSEAAPLVIGEAACLGTPVLSTCTSSAVEMVEKTGYGRVCGNTVEDMAQLLEELVSDPSEIQKRKQYLQTLQMDNEAAAASFEALIG